MKLGRLPHPPERLARAVMAARLGIVKPPPTLNRSALDYQPQTFSNDIAPDCTAVGLANAAISYGVVFGGGPPPIDPSAPLDFYGVCIGQPGASEKQLATTEGAVLLDVIGNACTNGWTAKTYADGTKDLLVPVHEPIPNTREAIAETLIQMAVEVGVRLYQRDMDTFGQGPWTASPADSGPLVGGHAFDPWDYQGLMDDDLIRIATWGTLQTATLSWLMARIDEAHGIHYPQLKRAP